MRRIVGLAMMVDGVLQALGVSDMMSTLADRDLRDQSLFAAHVIVGAGLLFAGRAVFGRSGPHTLPSLKSAGASLPRHDGPSVGVPVFLLMAALALSLIETSWYNWQGTLVRAVYTIALVFLLTRKTTLPTA